MLCNLYIYTYRLGTTRCAMRTTHIGWELRDARLLIINVIVISVRVRVIIISVSISVSISVT